MSDGTRLRIGCCISGHGFGHATRTIAVFQALGQRLDVELTLVTTAPACLFAESLSMPFHLHNLAVDVGLVQHNALAEDLPATLVALDELACRAEEQVIRIAALLTDCSLVLCDIAPLGIAAAKRAGIPSVLIENFTWDWIYEGYVDRWPQLRPYIDALGQLFRQADYHIQTRPVCVSAKCDLAVDPVARSLRQPESVRQRLYLEPGQHLVLLTMGGLGGGQVSLQPLLQRPDLVFVLPGGSRENEFTGNLRFLGQEAFWYHPDLVAAADLVVGKLGYSTVAEAYQAGTPYAYVPRSDFPESAKLAAFVDNHLLSWPITPQEWLDGQWLATLPSLPAERLPRIQTANGADQAAVWLAILLAKESHAVT
jgi:hypothetical protein